nr:hypothetical protein HK105_003398 [Polyrhizophydium stewartii]
MQNPSQPTTHFERTFANPKYAAASIVILLVGFNDSRVAGRDDAPEQTVANIHAICKVLANMGKLVFVCPVPNAGDASVSDELLEKNMRRNEMIAGFLQQSDRDLVVAGPNVDVLNFEYRVDRYYAADQQHFCAAGYAKLAKDFVDVLVNPMVRLEFKKFSKKLGL